MEFSSLPVDAPLRITSRFGKRSTGIAGASTNHKGIDLGRDWNKLDTAILAVQDGTVEKNYWQDYRGWVIVLRHDGTYTTLYQHLKAQSPLKVGQKVKAGSVIGVMGDSSNKSKLKVALHLHFELRKNDTPIDPESYLKNIKPKAEGGEEMTESTVRQICREELEKVFLGTNTTGSGSLKEEMETAKSLGITDGSRPGGLATREQCAVMALRAVRKAMERISSAF